MWDFLKNLKEYLSLDYRSLFILACICWAIVLLPINVWQEIGLTTLWSQLRPWFFMIGIVATIFLVFGGLYDLVKANMGKLNVWRDARKKQKANEGLMLSISRVEKEVLARYIADDTTTIAFDFRDGIVNGLIAKGILYRASQGNNPFSHDFDVNIQHWVWDYLKNHPEFLEGIVSSNIGRHQIRF